MHRKPSSTVIPGLLSLCLFFLVQNVFAQGATDGTIYSRFGIGDLRSFSTSQVQAMGGGGSSMLTLNYVNTQNPGSWGTQVFTRAAVGFVYQGLYTTDASENTSILTQGTLNAVQFGFPLLTQKLGVGISYEPYSRLDYRVRVEGAMTPGGSVADSSAYIIDYEGNGGLQKVAAGLGYRISRYLSIGANFDFYFGILESGRTTSFLETGYLQTRLVTATRMSGISGTVGAIAMVPGLLGEDDLLTIGAAVTLPAHLSGHRVQTLGQDLDRDTLGTRLQGNTVLPFRSRLGLSYRPDDRWTVVIDGQYEPWKQFESDFLFPGYTSEDDNLFENRMRASAGVEFLPGGGDPLTPFLQRVAYRLGFYYDEFYVNPVPDVNLNTIAITGGISLPTMFPGTRIDINGEVGTRGTTDFNLVRDTFYRLAVNVNVGERWFERRKLR